MVDARQPSQVILSRSHPNADDSQAIHSCFQRNNYTSVNLQRIAIPSTRHGGMREKATMIAWNRHNGLIVVHDLQSIEMIT
jgi:hypothetical protein